MAMKEETWLLGGKSPLMQSSPASLAPEEQEASDAIGTSKKKVYDDDEECEVRVYRNEKRQYVHPSTAFRRGLITAAKGRKIGKDFARSLVAGAVFMCDEYMVIEDPATNKPIKSYVKDVRTARVGTALIRRVRPKFPKWQIRVTVEIDTEMITVLSLHQLLVIFGNRVGLGELRPDSDGGKTGVGDFGRFDPVFQGDQKLVRQGGPTKVKEKNALGVS